MIRNQHRTWLGMGGILVVGSTLTLWHGIPGLLAAVVVALSWYVLPAVYAFTIGQFAFVAVVPESGQRILQTMLVEAGLIGILIEPVMNEHPRLAVLTGVGITVSVSLFWAVAEWLQPLWKTVGVLTVGLTLLAYGLHRYERLELGVIMEAT